MVATVAWTEYNFFSFNVRTVGAAVTCAYGSSVIPVLTGRNDHYGTTADILKRIFQARTPTLQNEE